MARSEAARERRLAYKRDYAKRVHHENRAPKVDERYEACTLADIPVGVRWKPAPGQRPDCPWRTFFTIGNVYKLIRILDTGAVTYFKLKENDAVTPADKIDAEVVPKRERLRLSIGAHVWFVDTDDRWYELEVVEKNGSNGRRTTFKPVTGWNDKRDLEWPYGELLEFPTASALYQRLRSINTRRP
jgi:hypothetical protein